MIQITELHSRILDQYVPLANLSQDEYIEREVGKDTITNFLNYLHLLAYSSGEGVAIFIGKNRGDQHLFQLDRSWSFGPILRLLNGDFTSAQLQILIESLNPVLIIQHYSQLSVHNEQYFEYFVETEKILSVLSKIIPKRFSSYEKFIKKYPKIKYLEIDLSNIGNYTDQIFIFLSEWENQTQIYPFFDYQVLKLIENFTNFEPENVGIGVVFDEENNLVLGLSCFSKSSKKVIASHINKVLRNYYQLGTFLFLSTMSHIASKYPSSQIICVGGGGTSGQKHFKDSFSSLGGKTPHNISIAHGDEEIIAMLKSQGKLSRVLTNVWASKREE